MRTRTLARGVALTEIGLGTAQFGNLYRETTDDEVAGAFNTAWESGIRYFDTAPHYGVGLSERRLGALLRTRPRNHYVLSTKVGRLLVPSPETAERNDDEGFAVPADPRRQWDLSADGIRRSIEDSLNRLGVDRIDIAYLHDPDDFGDQAVAEALPALAALRDEGMIRAIGAGMNQTRMLSRFIREADIDVVMVAGRFSLLNSDALDELLPLASNRGVSVVVAGVYNSGLLGVDRAPDDAKFNYEQAPREQIERAHAIADICEAHGVTAPQAAIAYPLHHPSVASVVVGSRTARQVESNVSRYVTEIPDGLWVELQRAGILPSTYPEPARTGESHR